MSRHAARAAAVVLLTTLLAAPGAHAVDSKPLRVCGDPDNLPFSNDRREGIENRIIDVIAADLGAPVVYFWWPHQRGLVKHVLNVGRCDIMVGVPKGYDPVLWTRPYYRSEYVLAYRNDRGLHLRSLDDPALKRLKIGVLANTPPHEALGRRGIVGDNVEVHALTYDSQFHPEEGPGRVMEDLIAGRIDVALVWGPIAGYYVKQRSASFVTVVPLAGSDSGVSFAFDISMGVRKGDAALRARLDGALERNRDRIQKILEDYGVPLAPLGDGR